MVATANRRHALIWCSLREQMITWLSLQQYYFVPASAHLIPNRVLLKARSNALSLMGAGVTKRQR